MESKLSTQDKERIAAGIRKKYAEASKTPQGLFNYPVGREGLERLEYDPKIIKSIPRPVVAFLLMECLMGTKTTQEVRRFMIYKNE